MRGGGKSLQGAGAYLEHYMQQKSKMISLERQAGRDKNEEEGI